MCFAGGQIYKNKLLGSFLWIFDLVQSKGGLWKARVVCEVAAVLWILLVLVQFCWAGLGNVLDPFPLALTQVPGKRWQMSKTHNVFTRWWLLNDH